MHDAPTRDSPRPKLVPFIILNPVHLVILFIAYAIDSGAWREFCWFYRLQRTRHELGFTQRGRLASLIVATR